MAQVKLVLGGGIFGSRGIITAETSEPVLKILEEHGVDTIDTAQLYGFDIGPGGSEKLLGETKAAERFVIDTKATNGLMNIGGAKKEEIIAGAEESMSRLQTKQVDIFYLHGPNAEVPIESTLDGINEVYRKGYFKRFGLSNYTPEDVEKVYAICKSNGYPLPSVYQGNYNPVARRQEDTLFPVLRKLGMSFYAYSPIAGGFLAKTKEQVLQGEGRFDPETMLGKMYGALYKRDILLDALADWGAIASSEGCPPAELAYRWVRYHSLLKGDHGDGVIFGMRDLKQLRETIIGLNNGPLKADSVAKIDEFWEKVKSAAPLDNMNPSG